MRTILHVGEQLKVTKHGSILIELRDINGQSAAFVVLLNCTEIVEGYREDAQ